MNTRSTFKDFAQALRTLGDFNVLAQWPVLTFIDLPGVAINFPHCCESDDVLTAVLVIQNQPAREVEVGSDLIRLLTELRAEKKANSTTRREEAIKRRTETILADAKSLVATEFKKLSRDELLAKFRDILGLPPEISKEEIMHMSDEDAYKNFLTSWNRSTLVQKTEQFILREGHPLNVHREMGGPAATVIRNILVNLMKVPDSQRVETLTQRLLDHYDLRNYQPRLSLVRELLALKVQERALQKALVSSFCPGPVNDGAAALGVVLKRVEAEAEKFASPEEVYVVSASDLETLVSRILYKW